MPEWRNMSKCIKEQAATPFPTGDRGPRRDVNAGDELFFDANGQRMRAVIPEGGGNTLRGD